jgi:hypothetical protein
LTAFSIAALGNSARTGNQKNMNDSRQKRYQKKPSPRPDSGLAIIYFANRAFLFFVIHGRFLSSVRPDDGRYFAWLAGLAAMKLHTPVVAPGLLKTHPQPRTPGQGTFFVQKPRQVVVVAAWLNWRAESAPAQRTVVTIAARNTVLIFLVMIAPCF